MMLMLLLITTLSLETGDWSLETRDWILETGDWRLETGDYSIRPTMRVEDFPLDSRLARSCYKPRGL